MVRIFHTRKVKFELSARNTRMPETRREYRENRMGYRMVIRCMYQKTFRGNPVCVERIHRRDCAYPSFQCDVKAEGENEQKIS